MDAFVPHTFCLSWFSHWLPCCWKISVVGAPMSGLAVLDHKPPVTAHPSAHFTSSMRYVLSLATACTALVAASASPVLVQSAAVAVDEVTGPVDVAGAFTVGLVDELADDGESDDEHPGRLAAAMAPSAITMPSRRAIRFTLRDYSHHRTG